MCETTQTNVLHTLTKIHIQKKNAIANKTHTEKKNKTNYKTTNNLLESEELSLNMN